MLSLPDTLQTLLTGFAEVVKVTSPSKKWDPDLAKYYPSDVRWIFHFGLDMASKSLVLALRDVAWSSTFMQPERNFFSCLLPVLNCAFNFTHTINDFDCFYGVIAKFSFVMHTFLNYATL